MMGGDGMTPDGWIDREGWAAGPWDEEPDRDEWRIGQFVGLALRQRSSGHWCGYLGVPPGHALHGRDWTEHDLPAAFDEAAHGGVNYSAACMVDDRPHEQRICHVAAPGEPDDVWWFGFDCSHLHDRAPGREADERARYEAAVAAGDDEGARFWAPLDEPWSQYRTLPYVRSRVTAMAEVAKGL